MDTERIVKLMDPESVDADEASDLELAMYIGDLLQKEYPNHPWVVSFQGRGLILRHLSIASEVQRVIGREGFASLLPRESMTTPKEIRRNVIRFAGELLEAFDLPRGPWDGRTPKIPGEYKYKQSGNFS